MDLYCAVFVQDGAVGLLGTSAFQQHHPRQKRHSISPLHGHFYEKRILLFYRLTCICIISIILVIHYKILLSTVLSEYGARQQTLRQAGGADFYDLFTYEIGFG